MNGLQYSNVGAVELGLAFEDARSCSHAGQCDADVARVAALPYVAKQLAAIDPGSLAAGLYEYGCWEPEELADKAQNLQRLVWLVAGDIAEGNGA